MPSAKEAIGKCDHAEPKDDWAAIPATLLHRCAPRFWAAVVGIGVFTGAAAAALNLLLDWTQQLAWGGAHSQNILLSAEGAGWQKLLLVLGIAGLLTGCVQSALRKLASGNDIDTVAAIWFKAGRLSKVRTLGSAVLSVVVVALGASLGKEGAPKQAGSVWANLFADWTRLSDEQRRLLVACGAGAGMAAAYNVPLGGALVALEVVRGMLALRFIFPALLCSCVAVAVAGALLPFGHIYQLPNWTASWNSVIFAVLCGLGSGLFSVVFVRVVRWAQHHKPTGWHRLLRPIIGLSALGCVAIWLPQLLGNGRELSQLLFVGEVPFNLAMLLLVLKPAVIVLCIGSGVPGGLFTPSLTSGALLGCTLGYLWSLALPHVTSGMCAFLGAGAVVAATTQGPLSTVVLLLELTGVGQSSVLPLIIAATIAGIVARTVEPRSIYDAKLTDEQIRLRQQLRDEAQVAPELIERQQEAARQEAGIKV